MKDQVTNLVQQGVNAAYINRSLTSVQYKKVLENTRQGKYKKANKDLDAKAKEAIEETVNA